MKNQNENVVVRVLHNDYNTEIECTLIQVEQFLYWSLSKLLIQFMMMTGNFNGPFHDPSMHWIMHVQCSTVDTHKFACFQIFYSIL